MKEEDHLGNPLKGILYLSFPIAIGVLMLAIAEDLDRENPGAKYFIVPFALLLIFFMGRVAVILLGEYCQDHYPEFYTKVYENELLVSLADYSSKVVVFAMIALTLLGATLNHPYKVFFYTGWFFLTFFVILISKLIYQIIVDLWKLRKKKRD